MRKDVGGYLSGLLTLACVVLCALLALNQHEPPEAVGAAAPPEEFSSGRALRHVETISRAPHEMGSREHAEVRDYILRELTASGVSPEVQRTTAVSMRGRGPVAGTVGNILARLTGTRGGGGKAVLLVSHYDSVPTSPGASDDGAGVAALLETLRALKSGPPLRNDVILLFTDGEENGLLGATAFVREHPWARDVGVALNFEARGNGGPSVMFETSGQNGWLIEELALAAPRPVSNSLAQNIYDLLPNDTDFSVLKEAGLPGMNFAFIEGLPRYHSQTDTARNLDERSLQHHGTYALALARRLGGLDETGRKARNAVYFNLPGPLLIHYSSAWVWPLTALVAAVFALVMFYGFRGKQLSGARAGLGFLACLLSAVVVSAGVYFIWYLISRSEKAYAIMPFGEPYNSRPYLLGFTAFTVAAVATLYALLRRRLGAENLMAGGLSLWLILLVLSGLFLSGGSYLFTWPLLFGLCGLAAAVFFKEGSHARVILPSLCALPGVWLFVPLIEQTFAALTVNLVWALMVFTVLLLWLLIPLLEFLISRHGWLLPSVALAVGLVSTGGGGLLANFDEQRPRPYHLTYALDADASKAVWASADARPHAWVGQFFPAGAQRVTLEQYYYRNPRKFLVSPAPLAPLPAPALTLVGDEKNGAGRRTLRLRLDAPENETSVFVNVSSAAKTLRASVNGKEIRPEEARGRFEFGTDWALRYHAPQGTGIDLTLEMDSHAPVKVRLTGLSRGLPDLPNTPVTTRPNELMPLPNLYSDSTLVAKSFSFD